MSQVLPPLLKDMVSDYSMRPIPKEAVYSHGHNVTILKLSPNPSLQSLFWPTSATLLLNTPRLIAFLPPSITAPTLTNLDSRPVCTFWWFLNNSSLRRCQLETIKVTEQSEGCVWEARIWHMDRPNMNRTNSVLLALHTCSLGLKKKGSTGMTNMPWGEIC